MQTLKIATLLFLALPYGVEARGTVTETRPCMTAISQSSWDAAMAGNISAQVNAGIAILNDECSREPGVVALAITWLTDAAKRDHLAATVALAMLYHEGSVVPQNRSQAVYYYRRAAQADQIDAQHTLGVLLLSSGQSRERDEGLFWLGAAAGQGDGVSAAFTGMVHAQGLHGVTRDVCLALDWYEASALLEAPLPVQSFIDDLPSTVRAQC